MSFSDLMGELRENTGGSETRHFEVLDEYLCKIDCELTNRGWALMGAKTTSFGYHDQSLLNHVRNGVFFLHQLDSAVSSLGGYGLSINDLQNAVALFVAHDLHKTCDSEGPEDEFKISREVVEEFVLDVGLDEFAPDLSIEDYWSCACAHHDSWKARTEGVTLVVSELLNLVRLADAFASSPTPEDAVSDRTRQTFDDVFYGELELRYHQLSDVKGILTNLCNASVVDLLSDRGYEVVTIYQDGCVYVCESSVEPTSVDEAFIDELYHRFVESISESHSSYSEATQLMSNIETGRLGYYDPSDEDFFYSGPERVIHAMVLKAAEDGNTDDDPTDSMSKGISKVDEVVPIDLDDTRQLVGAARLVYGIHRCIVPHLEADEEDFEATLDLFEVGDNVRSALREIREEDPSHLKSGGKWEYSYAIGQELLNRTFEGVLTKELPPNQFGDEVTKFLLIQLEEYPGWENISEQFTADIRSELVAYFGDIVTVDGYTTAFDSGLTDQFEEHTSKRGGKLCTLCNRGSTSSRKSDLETKKSLSTLQAGFSNRTRVGAGKPEKLLLCGPCRIEMSLRNAGAGRREPGRLFFHFVPDYFYTPLSWELVQKRVNFYDESTSVRTGRLAKQVFEGLDDEEPYKRAIEYTASEEGGLSMTEYLGQGFERGFGSIEFGYFKPHQNDTEFEFFGIFLALTIAAHSGLRVYVSDNPIPDLRGRDFLEFAKIGAGLNSTKEFYGDTIELDDLEETLKRTAALIQLGYANEREDSLFAKYLRACRNKPLPGSYLLKRLVQNDPDEGSRAAWNLMDQARYLDTTTGIQIHD